MLGAGGGGPVSWPADQHACPRAWDAVAGSMRLNRPANLASTSASINLGSSPRVAAAGPIPGRERRTKRRTRGRQLARAAASVGIPPQLVLCRATRLGCCSQQLPRSRGVAADHGGVTVIHPPACRREGQGRPERWGRMARRRRKQGASRGGSRQQHLGHNLLRMQMMRKLLLAAAPRSEAAQCTCQRARQARQRGKRHPQGNAYQAAPTSQHLQGSTHRAAPTKAAPTKAVPSHLRVGGALCPLACRSKKASKCCVRTAGVSS